MFICVKQLARVLMHIVYYAQYCAVAKYLPDKSMTNKKMKLYTSNDFK